MLVSYLLTAIFLVRFSFVGGDSLPESLLPHCDKLVTVINNLQNIVDKMSKWVQAVTGVKQLLESQCKADEIIFQVGLCCNRNVLRWNEPFYLFHLIY